MSISPDFTLAEAAQISIYQSFSKIDRKTFFDNNYKNWKNAEHDDIVPNTPDIELNVSPSLVNSKLSDYDSLHIQKYLVLPQKLDQPLYKLPEFIIQSCKTREYKYLSNVSDYDNRQLDDVYKFCKDVPKVVSGSNNLLKFYNLLDNAAPHQSLNEEIFKLSKHLTEDEILVSSQWNNIKQLVSHYPTFQKNTKCITRMSIISFFHMMRIKFILEYGRTKDKPNLPPFTNVYEAHIEYRESSYYMIARISDFHFEMMINQKYVCLKFGEICIVNYATHLNYLITISDTKFIMSVMRSSEEYQNTHDFIDDIESKIVYFKPNHSKLVKYMATMESLFLFLIDIHDTKICSHISIIDTIHSLLELLDLSTTETTIYNTWYSIIHLSKELPLPEQLDGLISSLKKITLSQLGTLSSIHKYLGISEIVYTKGWTKYHNRTGDRYNTSKDSMDRLILLFKYEFTYGYYKANNELPNFKIENASTRRLRSLIASNGESAFKIMRQLGDWKDIDLYGCLVPCQYDDVTPNLKDKACTVDDYTPGTSSAIKELEAYLMQPDSKPTDILQLYNSIKSAHKSTGRNHITCNNPQELETFISDNFTSRKYLTTRLVAKEKEQKEEGRYFGIASYKLKTSLSRMMELVKRAVKYFRDQIMTLTDTGRKNKIFDAGQSLVESDTYSLMLDISGHNQSMTRANCEQLLEAVMNLYGMEGYGVIAGIFEHLLIVQENKELGTYYATVGQSGGIEGWMNQLWGLQSALIMRLFTYDHSISTDYILTYSDDIDTIIRLPKVTPTIIMNTFIACANYYKKYGQVIKIKQTQITGCRVTMLKNHYVHGYQSETTIKRLMAYTIMSNKYYYCEALEAETINATTTSALENSTRIYTTTLIKHIYYLILGAASFMKHLTYNKDQSFLDQLDKRLLRMLNLPIGLSEKIKDLYEYNNGQSYTIKYSDDENYLIRCMDKEAKIYKNNEELKDKNSIKKIHDHVILSQHRTSKPTDLLEYYMDLAKNDKGTHRFLWIFKLFMPVSLGGFGATPLQDQMISGHSESRAKTVAYLIKLMKYYNINDEDFYYNLIYQHYYKDKSDKDEQSLVSSMYPSYSTSFTYKDIVKREIITYLDKGNYHNKDVKNYIMLYKDRSYVMRQIIELNRDKFVFRIARKYLDVSHVTLIEQFISKLEHSNTVLKLANSRSTNQKLIMEIFHTSVSAQNMLYQPVRYKINHVHYKTQNPEYIMQNIKIKNFPDIKFMDILEPTYDNTLIDQNTAADIIVDRGPLKRMTKGGYKYYEPLYNKSIKPKYQLRYEMNYYFTSPAEHKMFEAVRYTKWVIHTSSISLNKKITGANNIMNTCNFILSYYTTKLYHDLEKYVLTPTGGQIFHRTDNQGFKSSSAVKVATNYSGSITTDFTSNYRAITGGSESNVNFDYLRCKIVSSSILKIIYFSLNDQTGFIINRQNVQSFCDVRQNFLVKQELLEFDTSNIIFETQLKEERLRTFEAISQLMINGLQLEDIDLSVISLLDKLPFMEALEMQLLKLYTTVKQFLNVNHYISYDMITDEMKLQFLSLVDASYYEEKYETTWNLSELNRVINKSMDTERDRFILYQGSADKAAMDYLHQKYAKKIKSLEYLGRSVNCLKSILKIREFFTYTVTLLIIKQFLIFKLEQIGDQTKIVVNYDLSINNYLHSLEYLTSNKIGISNIPIFRRIFELYNKDLFTFNLDDVKDRIKLESKSWIINMKRIDLELESDNFADRFYITSSPIFHEFQYTEVDINCYELQYLNKGRKTIDWYMQTIKNHCTLKNVTSPTGSQSLQAQYNLLKALKNTGFNMTKVIDLCAGRGDGHLALDRLDIDHESITKNDIYDRISCVEGIEVDKTLNVLSFKTISSHLNGDTILIDISFTKGTGDIWETICHLLSINKKIIIRMNHLTSPSIQQLEFLSQYRIKFWRSEQSRNACYQLYLTFEPCKPVTPQMNLKYDETTIFDALRYDSLNFKQFDVFDVDVDEDIIVDSNMYVDATYLYNRQKDLLGGIIEDNNYYKTQAYNDILHVCIDTLDNLNLLSYTPILSFRPKDMETFIDYTESNNSGSIELCFDRSNIKESSLSINRYLMEKNIHPDDITIKNYNRTIEYIPLEELTNIGMLRDYITILRASAIPKEYYYFITGVERIYTDLGYDNINILKLKELIHQIIQKLGYHIEILDEFKGHYQLIIDSLIISNSNSIHMLNESDESKKMRQRMILQEAYVFTKKQLGKSKNAEKKMSSLLFYFRCIGNKVLRKIEMIKTASWMELDNIKYHGITVKKNDIEYLSSTDYTPVDHYLDNFDIEKLVCMFGFNTVYHKEIDLTQTSLVTELNKMIIPVTTQNVLMELIDITTIDTNVELEFGEEDWEGENIEYYNEEDY